MKIGNLQLEGNIFLAPMAGFTDAPFRSLVKEFGCALTFSEMVSAEGLVRNANKSLGYLKRFPDESPFAVQIFGSDPGSMAAAACIAVREGAQLLDINMGCPVKKILKNGAGAALLRHPEKIKNILKKVREAIDVPLTIKVRSGWRADVNVCRIACIAEEQGVDAITIHPRTVEQAFSGSADWGIIKQVKQSVRIPVVGNGDISSVSDAASILSQTGCDAIMVGRGAVGYPWIFNEIQYYLKSGKLLSPPAIIERRRAVERHWAKMISYYNDSALRLFKPKLSWYTRGLRGASDFRRKISGYNYEQDLLDGICEFFNTLEDA